MPDYPKKISFAAVTVSLIFLFLPNILIFDLLPDFIACFLLAAVFRRGEDAVPYFAEAKTALLRLSYWNLAKIAGIALIFFVRSKNTSDYDILALVCTIFAAGELVLSVSAAKKSFDALFYLGERSEASALIRIQNTDAEPLRTLTYLFCTVKCLGYSVPQFFALSSVNENGTVSVVSDSYPAMLLIFFTLALIVGTVWLIRMLRYTSGVRKEGLFDKELERLLSEQPAAALSEKEESRMLSKIFFFGLLSSFCLFTLRFESLDEINLLPHVLHAGLLLIFGCLLMKAAGTGIKVKRVTVSLGAGYLAVSLAAYVLDCIFYSAYKYPETGISEKEFLAEMARGAAGKFYRVTEICFGAELLFCAAYAVMLCLLLRRFIAERLGSRRTPTNDFTDDIKRLRMKAVIFTGGTLLSSAVNFGAVLLVGSVHTEELLQGDGTTSAVIMTRLPWYGTAAFAVALLACAVGISFFRSMKEEMTVPLQH